MTTLYVYIGIISEVTESAEPVGVGDGAGLGVGEDGGTLGGAGGAAQPAKTTDKTSKQQITMAVDCALSIVGK